MTQPATDIPEIRRGNKAECAQFFGVTLPTIDKWIRDGMPVVQRGSQGVSWVIDLHAAAQWRYTARLPSGQIDPETLPPNERKLWYDGEEKRRNLQERDRELIKESELSEGNSTAFSAVAQTVFSLRDLLERKAGLTPQQGELVDDALYPAMDELAEKMSKLAPLETRDAR